MSDDAGRLARLEDAFAAFLELGDDSTPEDRSRLLEQHSELRDLLEPMLEGACDTPVPPDDATTLGDFRLVRELGRGGMGVVHEAWQISLRRRVAVKVLPGWLMARPTAIARFRREAEIMAVLDHPGLVRVLAVGQDQGAFFYAMELVDGTPLADHVHTPRGRWRPRDAARVIRRVAEALGHAHRLGIVHRDVKPANILVRRDGSPVLTDFGLAHHDALPTVTRPGDFAGTPYYASPEQAAGEPVDARADVFSLGATLYELLTGRRAFAAGTTQGVLDLIRRRDPPEPHRVAPGVPRDLSAIVMKALAKEPEARYRDAGEMADDLRAFEQGRLVSARPPSTFGRAVRWTRREPLRATLAGVLVVSALIVSALAGYLWSSASTIEVGALAMAERHLEEHLEAGFALLELDHPDRALAELEAAHALQEDSVEAIAGMAIASARMGENDRAVRLLEDALRRREMPGLRRLRDHYRSSEDTSGTAAANSADRSPTSALDHFVVGLAEYERGRRDEDSDALRSALAHFRSAVIGSERARCVFHTSLATAAYEARDAGAAIEAADALERLWPDAVYTWFYSSYALVRADPERAIRAGRRALEMASGPDAPRVTDKFRSGVHNNIGNAWEMAGEPERAIAAWRRALQVDDGNARALCNLGRANLESDPEQARQFLAAAIDRDPHYARASRLLGRCLARLGDRAGALDAYEKAVRTNPRHVPSRLSLGQELGRADRHEEAIEHLRVGTVLAPELDTMWFSLGNALRRAGQLEEAVSAYTRAATLAPENPLPHVNAAGALLMLGRADEAVPTLQKALALRPDDPRTCFNLGLCHLSARQYEAGVPHLVAAIGKDAGTYLPLVRKSLLEPDGEEHVFRYDAALCRAAIACSPDADWAHEALVVSLRGLGDHLGLREELCRFAELRPEDAEVWRALAEHCLSPGLPEALRAPATALEAARRAQDPELVRRAAAAVRALLGEG